MNQYGVHAQLQAMFSALFIWALLPNLAACLNEDFIFNGFRGANLSVDGVAAITSDGLLMLTNMTQHAMGHAFYSVPLHFRKSPIGNILSFSTNFVFAITSEYPTMGGHGFAFVLSPSKEFSGAFSNQFFGLFNSSNNGKPSNHVFAVEFDTIKNYEFGDINDNHVGIDINNLRSNESVTASYVSNNTGGFKNLSLISGEAMQVWIEYDGTKMQLNVTLAPIQVAKPIVPLLSTTMNLSSVILDYMYAGFSSSTGIIHSNHCILGWSFKIDGKAKELNLSGLPSLPPRPRSSKARTKALTLTLWLAIAAAVVVLATLAGIALMLVRKNKFSELFEDWELEFGTHRFSYADLFKATEGFNDKNLLGAGGFGRVYRGVLATSEVEVAVKRVSHESRQGVKEFIAEIVSIGNLRHRNLVQLLGYCRRQGELLLVYAFMPNGSLDKLLFSQAKSSLSWGQRFQIIKGVASGLLYLHEEWEQVIIHGDIKASNVLLDCDMNARLGDFGLAKLHDRDSAPHTTHVVGTMGYIAPELARTGKATASTDVFAFGAFLLEVACGRRPLEQRKEGREEILVDWVFGNWRRGEILASRDPRLGDDYVVEELEMVLKLGLFCLHPTPPARPSMKQVVQFLDGDIPLPDLSLAFQSEGFSNYIMSYPSLLPATSVLLHSQ